MVNVGPVEKRLSEYRLEGGEGANHVPLPEERVAGRRNNLHPGGIVGIHLVPLKTAESAGAGAG